MAIKYPIDCDIPMRRTEWLYRAQELLRLFHNKVGKWHTEGMTQVSYDAIAKSLTDLGATTLRSNLAALLPFKEERLTDEEWNTFTTNFFDPISGKISTNICAQRALLKESITWTVNLDDI